MKVVIRETAGADLRRIYRWIAKDSPINAQSVATQIMAAVEDKIPAFPDIGRKGRSKARANGSCGDRLTSSFIA